MQPLDAADQRLLTWLYSHHSIDHADIDRCIDDYQVLRARGQAVSLADIVLRQQLVSQESLAAMGHCSPDVDTGAYHAPKPSPKDPTAWVWSVLGIVTLPALVLGGIVVARGMRDLSRTAPQARAPENEASPEQSTPETTETAPSESETPPEQETPSAATRAGKATTTPTPSEAPPSKVGAKQRPTTPYGSQPACWSPGAEGGGWGFLPARGAASPSRRCSVALEKR